MDINDITSLPDEEFDAVLAAMLADQVRRFNMRQIPADIAELAAQYREGGGDESALAEAIEPERPAQAVPDGAAADHFDYLPEED